jgi:iron(III) transport system permease protein
LILLERSQSRSCALSRQQWAPARNVRQVLPAGMPLLGADRLRIPVVIGFALPAMLLMRLAMGNSGMMAANFSGRFLILARNSLSCWLPWQPHFAAAMALLLGFAARDGRRISMLAGRVVGLGYAVPGSVIAVGVLIPVTRLDHWLADLWQQFGGGNPGLILTGGIAALVYAYLARFLAIALQTVEAGLASYYAEHGIRRAQSWLRACGNLEAGTFTA